MLELIDKVLSDSTFVWVVVILAVMLTLATFKKLYKLVMIIVAAFIIYVGYLYYTGEEPVEAIDDLIIKAEDVIEDLKDTDLIDIKESTEKVIKDTKKNLQKKIK